MTGNKKDIKNKIKSVKSINKITKAMEMIARAKMKKAIDNAIGTRNYANLALELLVNLAADKENLHPLLETPKDTTKKLLIHIAGNKGLCGNFNSQMEKILNLFLDKNNIDDFDFITIGKKAKEQVLKKFGKIIFEFEDQSDDPIFNDYQQLYSLVIDSFKNKEYKNVYISYSNFSTVFIREQFCRIILPISEKSIANLIEDLGGNEDAVVMTNLKNKQKFSQYLYEPNRDFILETILYKLLSIQIYQAILESKASEESARMVAMKNASENSQKITDELNLRYNRLRQAGITSEIIDISLGALAINQDN